MFNTRLRRFYASSQQWALCLDRLPCVCFCTTDRTLGTEIKDHSGMRCDRLLLLVLLTAGQSLDLGIDCADFDESWLPSF